MRTLRRTLQLALPLLGIAVAFAGVLYLESRTATLLAVLLGILLAEAGTWKLANPFLPSDRRFNALRAEVDDFIAHVRVLNTAAGEAQSSGSPEAWTRYRETLQSMHRSVELMGELAGQEEGKRSTRAPAE